MAGWHSHPRGCVRMVEYDRGFRRLGQAFRRRFWGLVGAALFVVALTEYIWWLVQRAITR